MALRRDEDAAAVVLLGAEPVHSPLPEAPHRGLHQRSRSVRRAARRRRDRRPPARRARPCLRDADLVLAPQAIGDHVDHRVVAEVVADLAPFALWRRDTPYVLRRPDAPAWRAVPPGAERHADVGPYLETNAAAARCYVTQVGFQFGGADRVAGDLQTLAHREAQRVGAPDLCEVFVAPCSATDGAHSTLRMILSVSLPYGG